MLAGGKRLSPTEPTGETGGLRSNSDEVEMNNDCFRNLHLTTAYGGASPQGEAFGKAF